MKQEHDFTQRDYTDLLALNYRMDKIPKLFTAHIIDQTVRKEGSLVMLVGVQNDTTRKGKSSPLLATFTKITKAFTH